jgi:hypothetical protein
MVDANFGRVRDISVRTLTMIAKNLELLLAVAQQEVVQFSFTYDILHLKNTRTG